MLCFKICVCGVDLKIMVLFFLCFSKIALFGISLRIYFIGVGLFNHFSRTLILRYKILSSKRSLRSLKIYKKHQNHTFTNLGVIWKILKFTKIRGQSMGNWFLVVCFRICVLGVCFKMRTTFLGF